MFQLFIFKWTVKIIQITQNAKYDILKTWGEHGMGDTKPLSSKNCVQTSKVLQQLAWWMLKAINYSNFELQFCRLAEPFKDQQGGTLGKLEANSYAGHQKHPSIMGKV